jgi:hypothetical protein
MLMEASNNLLIVLLKVFDLSLSVFYMRDAKVCDNPTVKDGKESRGVGKKQG